jgi:hypothetical protein
MKSQIGIEDNPFPFKRTDKLHELVHEFREFGDSSGIVQNNPISIFMICVSHVKLEHGWFDKNLVQ